MTTEGPRTLRDLGEGRIVRELIAPRFPNQTPGATGIGDDCAVLPAPPPGEVLVLTTDPCPVPVVCLVEAWDYYHLGRMTSVVNLSDLAAMGARPLCLLVSTVMPEDMLVADYERFLDGLAEACREWACPVLGGNIKDAPAGGEFTATATAVGAVRQDRVLRRTGARPGDRVCVVGEMGRFWAAVLTRLRPELQLPGDVRDAVDEALYRPIARVREGLVLSATDGVSSTMDASDGVSACLSEIAHVNGVDIVLDAGALCGHPAVSRVAEAAGVDVRKLLLSWGNWELVTTVRPGSVPAVRAALAPLGTSVTEVGEVTAGSGLVWVRQETGTERLNNFASERFSRTSLFSHGLEAYWTFLRDTPLTAS